MSDMQRWTLRLRATLTPSGFTYTMERFETADGDGRQAITACAYPSPDGDYVAFTDVERLIEEAYQKGRDHGWALNAECCGSCHSECAQRIALHQMTQEGRR